MIYDEMRRDARGLWLSHACPPLSCLCYAFVCVRVRIIRVVRSRAITARIDRPVLRLASLPDDARHESRTSGDYAFETRKTRICTESRRFRVTACTSTGRPSSCALTTALPGVLTDSARLGSARHTVRRSAAQTRRGEMRRGRLPSTDYHTTTADPTVAARAL